MESNIDSGNIASLKSPVDNLWTDSNTPRVLRKIISRERLAEFLAADIMTGLEIAHDYILHPKEHGVLPSQVGKLPTDPVAAWAVDHIGDMLEVSLGFTAMRLGFVAINEIFKNNRVVGLQKELLKNEKAKKLVSKVVGIDRVNKWASGENVQIPDGACFWASLISAVTVTATHSLGMYSLIGPLSHDHVGHPVTGMLFGQGVAAVVLATSHYAAKYHEPIKDLAVRVGVGFLEGTRFVDQKIKKFESGEYFSKINDPQTLSVDTDGQNSDIFK